MKEPDSNNYSGKIQMWRSFFQYVDSKRNQLFQHFPGIKVILGIGIGTLLQ